MHWGYEWSWWGWLIMTTAMIGFWVLVGWFIYSLVATGNPSATSDLRTPEQILAERFAAGEIDEHEYRERLDTLRSTKTAGAR